MGALVAAAAPQLGNPAGGQVKVPAVSEPFSGEDLARRRAASRRLGWAIGAAVLALYVIGLFVKR
jgi:hypothetical protein